MLCLPLPISGYCCTGMPRSDLCEPIISGKNLKCKRALKFGRREYVVTISVFLLFGLGCLLMLVTKDIHVYVCWRHGVWPSLWLLPCVLWPQSAWCALCAACAASPPLAFCIHRNKMTKVISGNLKELYRRSMFPRNRVYFSEAVA